jgi:hypothetical protein
LLVPTVIADARNFQIPAIAKISAPARETRAVVTAMPANPDTLPFLPPRNTGTDFIDYAGHFMSGDAGVLNPRPDALFRKRITMANPTGFHLDPDVSWTWRRNRALHNLEFSPGTGDLRYLHGSYCNSCRSHKSSYDSRSW